MVDLYDDTEFGDRPVDAPVGSLEDKWLLVPAYTKTKGLVRQHLESFNYFVEHELRNIVRANERVESEIDPTFYLK